MIDKYGALVLSATIAFDDYCKENNIKDPLKEQIKIQIKTVEKEDGFKYLYSLSLDELNDKDKEKLIQLQVRQKEYEKQKNKFIINYIIDNGTYDDVITFCTTSLPHTL